MIIGMLLTSCAEKTEEENQEDKNLKDNSQEDNSQEENNQEENNRDIIVGIKDEIFELKLYADKSSYSTDEIIFCYATLEYIGEGDSITVYSSDPLLGFGLRDDKYFEGGYAVNDILMTTRIQKGVIYRYEYSKSGGWGSEDPNAEFYEKFYKDRNLILPAGKYEITAAMNCSMDQEDIMGSQYNISISTELEVIN